MKKIFLTVAALLLVTGCTTKPGCAVEGAAASLISAGITTQLVCKNSDAVKADVLKELAKLKLCAATDAAKAQPVAAGADAQSIIGDIVCKPIVDSLVAGLLAKIPSTWECTGGTSPDLLKEYLLKTCKQSL